MREGVIENLFHAVEVNQFGLYRDDIPHNVKDNKTPDINHLMYDQAERRRDIECQK